MSSYTFDTFMYNLLMKGIIGFPPSTGGTITIRQTIFSLPISFYTARAGLETLLYGDKLYIIGGFNSNGLSDKITIIDLAAPLSPDILDAVTSVNLPVPMIYHESVIYNDMFYIFGGYDDPSTNVSYLYRFDPSNNTFQQLASSPVEAMFSTIDLVNDRLFLIGGYDQSRNPVTRVYIYNISQNTWSASTNNPFAMKYGHASAVLGNYIYVFGGFNNNGQATNDLRRFDVTSNSWSNITLSGDIPEPRANAILVPYNNFLYLFGGSKENGYTYSDIIKINPQNGQCQFLRYLEAPRTDADYIIYENFAIIFGGFDGYSQFLTQPVIFSLSTEELLSDFTVCTSFPQGFVAGSRIEFVNQTANKKATLAVTNQGLAIFINNQLVGYFDETGYHNA